MSVQVDDSATVDDSVETGTVSKKSKVLTNDGSEYAVLEKITTMRSRIKRAKAADEDFIMVRGPNGRLMFNVQLMAAIEEVI